MTSDKCETYLYLTLGVLGQTKKNMHLPQLPSPGYRIFVAIQTRSNSITADFETHFILYTKII
jgi:hypothetical protein